MILKKNELEERLKEHEEKMYGIIHKKVIEGIMTIEDAKYTMAQLAEVKKMNIRQIVGEAVDAKINSKIDLLNKNIETFITEQQEWSREHILYHKKHESDWGIIRRIRNTYDKNPIRLMSLVVVASTMYVKISRDFIIDILKNLWKSLF